MKSPRLARWVATLGPVGYLPIAPGTWGSGVAAVVYQFGAPGLKPLWCWLILLITTAIGVWTATLAERELGRDAKPIVIDEVVGQWLTLMFVPIGIITTMVGFFLFRFFDVWKPFPARVSQKLPGGVGVVIDDLLAGLYAAAVLWVLERYLFGRA